MIRLRHKSPFIQKMTAKYYGDAVDEFAEQHNLEYDVDDDEFYDEENDYTMWLSIIGNKVFMEMSWQNKRQPVFCGNPEWIRTQHIVRCSASSTDLIAGRLSEVYNKLVEKLDSIKEYENE